MAGNAIGFKHNAARVADKVYAIARRCGSPEPALEIMGAHLVDSVIQNFEGEGRPQKWQELSDATKANKKGGAILRVHGMAGGLMGSIHYEVEPHQLMVGTDKVYGAIHQFGGEAGPGHKVKIPAREFLVIQDEDWDEMVEQLGDFLLSEE